jgi:uncharacterized protein
MMFFASDLHGAEDRYLKLFAKISLEKPQAVFLGGDLLPTGLLAGQSVNSRSPAGFEDFISRFLLPHFQKLRRQLADEYPRVFLILGNDDGRFVEEEFVSAQDLGIWEYMHNRQVRLDAFKIFGFSFVPPSPFLLKDWERYDVSRYVAPGCVSPEEGFRSFKENPNHTRYSTISEDLRKLTGEEDLENSIFLFHTPPYKCSLDRAGLDGKLIDHVPLDVHVGSVAVRRFIEQRKPRIALHGHIHESARLTGSWHDKIGDSYIFGAAHDGAELALLRFDPLQPELASRELV